MVRHPRHPPLPWLALPDGTFFSFPSSAALRFPAAAAAGYLGSCDDWLLFDGGGDHGYLLANPFTGDTVRLPGLSRVRFVVGDGGAPLAWRGIADDWRAPFGATVRKLSVSPGGRVAAAMVDDGRLGLSWVMSGHDAWRGITDIALYDGAVYAVEDTGDLLAMPTGVDGRSAKCIIKQAAPGAAPPATARRRSKQAPPPSMRYLLVHGGKLMMGHRTTLAGDGGAAAKFAMFVADLAASRWSEVAGVGDDTALFVARWRSLARRLSPYGMPGNRIHFLDDDRWCVSRGCRDKQFGSYDTVDGKTYPLLQPPVAELSNNGAGGTPATWLFPGDDQGVIQWCDLPCDVLGLVLASRGHGQAIDHRVASVCTRRRGRASLAAPISGCPAALLKKNTTWADGGGPRKQLAELPPGAEYETAAATLAMADWHGIEKLREGCSKPPRSTDWSARAQGLRVYDELLDLQSGVGGVNVWNIATGAGCVDVKLLVTKTYPL